MTDPLDRARQLIAKAVDPAVSVEEARSCAHAAAKIIAQHKLLDSVEAPVDPRGDPRNPFDGMGAGLDAFWEIFVRHAGRSGGASPQPQGPWEPFPRQPRASQNVHRPPPEPPRSRGRPVRPTYPSRRPWWETLPNELFVSVDRPCAVCREICPAGSKVWAIRLEPAGNGQPARPVVCHFACKHALTPEERRRGADE